MISLDWMSGLGARTKTLSVGRPATIVYMRAGNFFSRKEKKNVRNCMQPFDWRDQEKNVRNCIPPFDWPFQGYQLGWLAVCSMWIFFNSLGACSAMQWLLFSNTIFIVHKCIKFFMHTVQHTMNIMMHFFKPNKMKDIITLTVREYFQW